MVSGDSIGNENYHIAKQSQNETQKITKQIYDHWSAILYSRVPQMTLCCETSP